VVLPNNVKQQPDLLEHLFWFNKARGRTFFQTIYLKKDIYDDLKSGSPAPENLSVLAHEQTHIERIKKIGITKYSFKYFFFGKFRFNEELEANKAAFRILKKHKVEVDLTRKARILSSWIYLWPVSYNYALDHLKKSWEEV